MKPSEINAEITQLSEHPHMGLSLEIRKQYLSAEDQAKCEQAEARIEELKALKREIVARVADKMHRLVSSPLYTAFRHAGSGIATGVGDATPIDTIPAEAFDAKSLGLAGDWNLGGIYCQDEDRREEFVDAMLSHEGL